MTFRLPPNVLDRDLVLDFFWKFSVFECALKREGYLRSGRNNGAEPDWERFGLEVQGRFAKVSNPGFAEAVDKLRLLSPRRQVVRDGRVGWDPIVHNNGESEEAYILHLLKTARNNLFHGGKYPDGPIDEVARDRDILRAALAILDGCYELHAGVQRWIDEAA
jgi:hypothetical protein